jgi:tetratricopeptide (TPR) repeat protein
VLLAGLAVRIVYLAQLNGSDLNDLLALDTLFYRELSSHLLSGGGIPGGAISFNPLYPAFLVVVFRLFGGHLLAVRIIQAAIGLATIYLAYRAGVLLAAPEDGNRRGTLVGLVAAGLMLLYPHFLLYEGSLLATTIVTFILLAVFVLALLHDQRVRGVRPAAAGRITPPLLALGIGLLVGAGILGRPNIFFLLAAALPVWIVFRHPDRRRGLRNAVLCIAGTILFLVPPILYNASRTGRFVPVTTHGGINFYIGNRPGAVGKYDPPEGMRADMRGLVEDARFVAEQRVGRAMTDAEASNFWFREAFEAITSDPARWFTLLGRKLLLFFNGVELADVLDISFYRDACPAMKFLVMPFALLSPLSVLGLIAVAMGGRNRSIVFLFAGALLASILLFYVNSRYRVPGVPVLILCGALFIARFAGEVRRRRWLVAIAAVVLFAAVFLFVANRRVFVVNKSAMHAFLGNHYLQRRDIEKAETAFAEAYRLDPQNFQAQINYARALLLRGKPEASERFYTSAFAAAPDFPNLAVEYGSLLDQMGRREEAKNLYRYAYELPRTRDRVLACKHLARDAMAEGDRHEAILWVRRALELTPGDGNLVEWLHALEGESRR